MPTGHSTSYREFWTTYVLAHQHPFNRGLHYLGTTLAMIGAGLLIWWHMWLWLALTPVVGYGLAWLGHVLFEKNTPLTFRHPLWSFASDYRMWWSMLCGTFPAELNRARGSAAHARTVIKRRTAA